MRVRIAVTAAALMVVVGMVVDAPRVVAEPIAPQQDTPCSVDLSGALTQLPDQKTVLQCQSRQGEFRWQGSSTPYPKSDRWLTYGPALTLHGEGQPNREVDSGDWNAYPQDP